MSEGKGPANAARSQASAKRTSRGGAVPSPKKHKQKQEKLAVEAAAGKRVGAPAAAPIGLDPVGDLTATATEKLAAHWRVIVAVTAVAAVVLGLLWLRSERARARSERAWVAFTAAERGEGAKDPEAWAALAEQYDGTAAAVFMRLREADALVRRGEDGDLERAHAIYAQHADETGVRGFLGREGDKVVAGWKGFAPSTPPAEQAPGLRPLAVTPSAAVGAGGS